jgi:hypothetical protein
VNAACPIQYGGLGIPNLHLMGFALRLRWLWLDRVDSDKTWSRYFFSVDWSAQAFFDASVTVQVGDDSRVLFWSNRWLNGCSILQLAPDLCNAVPPRIRKSNSVRDALSGRRWIRNITFARTVPVVVQYLRLGITCRISTCPKSPTNSSGNARLTGNFPLVQHTECCFWKNLASWC